VYFIKIVLEYDFSLLINKIYIVCINFERAHEEVYWDNNNKHTDSNSKNSYSNWNNSHNHSNNSHSSNNNYSNDNNSGSMPVWQNIRHSSEVLSAIIRCRTQQPSIWPIKQGKVTWLCPIVWTTVLYMTWCGHNNEMSTQWPNI